MTTFNDLQFHLRLHYPQDVHALVGVLWDENGEVCLPALALLASIASAEFADDLLCDLHELIVTADHEGQTHELIASRVLRELVAFRESEEVPTVRSIRVNKIGVNQGPAAIPRVTAKTSTEDTGRKRGLSLLAGRGDDGMIANWLTDADRYSNSHDSDESEYSNPGFEVVGMSKRKSKTQQAATPFNTGGGGFDVEDRFSAWMLAYMLVGVTPPGVDVTAGWRISSIAWQVPVAKWLFNDLLIELGDPSGSTMRLAISIKAGSYFTALTPPAELIMDAWRQLLGVSVEPLENNTDRIVLAAPELASKQRKQWRELWDWAYAQDDEALETNVATAHVGNEEKRAILAAIGCPADLRPGRPADQLRVGRLLRHLRFIEHDLRNAAESRTIGDAVAMCRRATAGSEKQAVDLWNDLIRIGGKMRPNSGRIDLPTLLGELRVRHRLVANPDFESDWVRIGAETRRRLARVRDTIGTVRLARTAAVKELRDSLQENRFTVLLADSGAGKTVTAKRLADALLGEGRRVVWLEADQVNESAGIGASIKLGRSLVELVKVLPDAEAYLFLDRVDRLNDVGVANAMELLRVNNTSRVWRVVATSVPTEWQRFETALVTPELPAGLFRPKLLPELTREELREVCSAHGNLGAVATDPRLRRLMQRPRVLDLVASSAVSHEKIGKWVSESDLIHWFFESVVDLRPAAGRRSVAIRLAAHLADEFADGVPEDELQSGEAEAVASLSDDRILRRRDGCIGFDHDLLADWCRQQYLVARVSDLAAVLLDGKRRHNPVWYRAIRLLGLWLLEAQQDPKKLIDLLRSLELTGERTNLGDELLACPIQAADPTTALDRIWPFLKGEGEEDLLPRMLERMHTAMTVPHPQFGRIPTSKNWPTFVKWLHGKRGEALTRAPEWAATIADTWLRGSMPKWPVQREAAELAIAIAVEARTNRGEGTFSQEGKEAAYRALFAATAVIPDAAVSLIRRCAELVSEDEPKASDISPEQSGFTASAPQGHAPISPYGPLRSVESAFKKVCLDWIALDPLAVSRPDIAADAVLASILPSAPRHRHYLSATDRLETAASDGPKWSPALWFRGPFARMLKVNERVGIDLVLRLVNHITDVWRYDFERNEHAEGKGAPPYIEIEVDGKWRQWYGGGDQAANLFEWHTVGHRCPGSVQCALIALEHHLYTALVDGRTIDGAVLQILKGSRSVAFAGLLAALANYRPILLGGSLGPLLTCIEAVWLDEMRRVKREDKLCAGIGLPLQSPWIQQQVRDWYLMPHRDRGLLGHFMLCTQQTQHHASLGRERDRLKSRLDAGEVFDLSKPLDLLAAYCDPGNWKSSTVANEIRLEFVRPPHLRPGAKEIADSNDRMERLFTPSNCRDRFDNNKPFTKDELDAAWARLERFAQARKNGDRDPLLADGVAGLAAVLLIHHADWLAANEGRRARCVGLVEQVFQSPPPPTAYDVEGANYSHGWDRFAAEVAAIEWSRSPADPKARSRIGQLVASYHHETLGHLLRQVIQLRDTIGADDVSRLFQLTLRFAGLRWSVVNHRIVPSEGEASFRAMISSFVDAKISAKRVSWRKLASEFGGLYERTLEQLVGALPAPKLVITSDEWQEWKTLVHDALGWVCADDHGHELNTKVLNLSAEAAAWAKDDEEARQIFDRVLSVRANRSIDIATFGNFWISQSLEDAGPPPGFARRWNILLDRAFEALHVDSEVRSVWDDLLGLDPLSLRYWRAEHGQLFDGIREPLRRWVSELARKRQFRLFAHFVLGPAGSRMLPDAVIWIGVNQAATNPSTWRDEDDRRPVLSLLQHIRIHYADALRQNPLLRTPYLAVLSAIAATGDNAAIDLQAKIGDNGVSGS